MKPECETQTAVGASVINALERNELVLQSELPKLLTDSGKFALVFDQKYIGAFVTYQDALEKGYEMAGSQPFLIQQISQVPQVQAFFSYRGKSGMFSMAF
jgi:hypothetical protein